MDDALSVIPAAGGGTAEEACTVTGMSQVAAPSTAAAHSGALRSRGRFKLLIAAFLQVCRGRPAALDGASSDSLTAAQPCLPAIAVAPRDMPDGSGTKRMSRPSMRTRRLGGHGVPLRRDDTS